MQIALNVLARWWRSMWIGRHTGVNVRERERGRVSICEHNQVSWWVINHHTACYTSPGLCDSCQASHHTALHTFTSNSPLVTLISASRPCRAVLSSSICILMRDNCCRASPRLLLAAPSCSSLSFNYVNVPTALQPVGTIANSCGCSCSCRELQKFTVDGCSCQLQQVATEANCSIHHRRQLQVTAAADTRSRH